MLALILFCLCVQLSYAVDAQIADSFARETPIIFKPVNDSAFFFRVKEESKNESTDNNLEWILKPSNFNKILEHSSAENRKGPSLRKRETILSNHSRTRERGFSNVLTDDFFTVYYDGNVTISNRNLQRFRKQAGEQFYKNIPDDSSLDSGEESDRPQSPLSSLLNKTSKAIQEGARKTDITVRPMPLLTPSHIEEVPSLLTSNEDPLRKDTESVNIELQSDNLNKVILDEDESQISTKVYVTYNTDKPINPQSTYFTIAKDYTNDPITSESLASEMPVDNTEDKETKVTQKNKMSEESSANVTSEEPTEESKRSSFSEISTPENLFLYYKSSSEDAEDAIQESKWPKSTEPNLNQNLDNSILESSTVGARENAEVLPAASEHFVEENIDTTVAITIVGEILKDKQEGSNSSPKNLYHEDFTSAQENNEGQVQTSFVRSSQDVASTSQAFPNTKIENKSKSHNEQSTTATTSTYRPRAPDLSLAEVKIIPIKEREYTILLSGIILCCLGITLIIGGLIIYCYQKKKSTSNEIEMMSSMRFDEA